MLSHRAETSEVRAVLAEIADLDDQLATSARDRQDIDRDRDRCLHKFRIAIEAAATGRIGWLSKANHGDAVAATAGLVGIVESVSPARRVSVAPLILVELSPRVCATPRRPRWAKTAAEATAARKRGYRPLCTI